MYNDLILFRNELKNKNVPKYKLAGIVAEMLFSKTLFPKNRDIEEFLRLVFGLEFKNYIMKSRTMIVSKIIKKIVVSDEKIEYKKELLDFINVQIEKIKTNEGFVDKKNEFNGWIK